MKKEVTKRHAQTKAWVGIAVLTTLVLLGSVFLVACSAKGSSAAEDGVSEIDRTNAKQVIMAAGDLFTIMDLGLTDQDSPVIISQSDAKYANFFEELQRYKKVNDLDVKDLEINAYIQAIHASTAREDSQQINYRYTITTVNMTVNGVPITYDSSSGFTTG